ncbi:MAG: hypothetical protein LBP59_13125 [Planctomycetaceae bacterium]|nr:hypothetical protein [Planctomycetaceae bacterium]
MLQKISNRIAGVSSAFQDRGRLACMRLYSTAVERSYISTNFFVCILANCRRDACVSSQFFVTKNYLIRFSQFAIHNYLSKFP